MVQRLAAEEALEKRLAAAMTARDMPALGQAADEAEALGMLPGSAEGTEEAAEEAEAAEAGLEFRSSTLGAALRLRLRVEDEALTMEALASATEARDFKLLSAYLAKVRGA